MVSRADKYSNNINMIIRKTGKVGRRSLFFLGFCVSLLSFCLAQAHILQLSNSDFVLNGQQATWTLQVHLSDFENKFSRTDDTILKNYLSTRLTLSRGGEPCRFEDLKVEKEVTRERVTLRLQFECPAATGDLQVGYDLFYGDPSHRHIFKAQALGRELSYNFSPENTRLLISLGGRPGVFSNFFKLGFEHILAGYDHILFLITLVFAAYRFKDLFGLVTAFTIGHSISLALSVQNIFTLSPAIVEPLIAASIVFVACHDLLRKPEHTPWAMIFLTFAFGLIHGLGFSYALREADLSGGGLVLPLFSFNLGVEFGQVLLIGVAYPGLFALRRWTQVGYHVVKRVCLSLIAALALYWLVERVFFT